MIRRECRSGSISSDGANRRHEIRLFHTKRKPLPQQSAFARAISCRDTRPGGVGGEAWTKHGARAIVLQAAAGAVDHSPALDGRALTDFFCPACQVFIFV